MKRYLQWLDDRWHCDGQGIHAGDCMEMQWPDGTWQTVRIESGDQGRTLFACFDYHGQPFSVLYRQELHDLRWPAFRFLKTGGAE